SLTAKSQPSAYFVTDHGETYYDVDNPTSEASIKTAYLYDLLTERGLNVKTLSLKELVSEGKDIYDDCVLLIINNPREDFTYSESSLDNLFSYTETDIIDRYLVKNAGAVMVAKDFEITLPVFEQFMHEWGFDFGTSLVKDEVSSGGALSGENEVGGMSSSVIGQYNKDTESYGYAIYEEYARLESAPRFVFSNAGYIVCSYDDADGKNEDGTHKTSRYYSSLFSTSSGAKAYFKNENGEYSGLLDKDKGVKDIAAVATRIYTDHKTAEYTYSYMFCANSADFFSNELLSNDSYANFGVISLLVDNISRIDEYASIELGGSSMNSTSYAGKHLRDSALSEVAVKIYAEDAKTVIKENRGISSTEIVVFSIIPFAVTLAVLVAGIVIRIKRRYL
ncbi:MAG: hypothetical protein IIX96_00250, partial [Clostridia bacterium]|nr:hypothetical protein [Clostridia bacterium]